MKRAALAVAAACLLTACGGSHPAATGSVHPPGWGRPYPHAKQLFSAVPTATMWDSVNGSTIPVSPFALAGYTSGNWPNYLTFRSRYPRAHTISVAVNTGHHADCLDIEPGDAIPSQAAGWVRADIAAGFAHPCLYSSYWEFLHQVQPDLNAAGIARGSVFEWDADFTGRPGLDAGFDATQWTDHALGRNLDESTVTLAFLSIAQPPYVAPQPPQRTVCYGRHAQHSAACRKVLTQVASDQRARDQSAIWLAHDRFAYSTRNCRRPLRRGECIHLAARKHLFAQRVRYFNAAQRSLIRRYS